MAGIIAITMAGMAVGIAIAGGATAIASAASRQI
jgi:hypothetical protein